MAGDLQSLTVQRTFAPLPTLASLPFATIRILDLSNNSLGPHAFSCICYAVAGLPQRTRHARIPNTDGASPTFRAGSANRPVRRGRRHRAG
jgi:hypothetical protein